MDRNADNPDRQSLPPGAKGTYGQHDQSSAAARNALRKDQRPPAQPRADDPFGEGGFSSGGAKSPTGEGDDFGQLQPSQRQEGSVEQARGGDSAQAGGIEGTPSESNR